MARDVAALPKAHLHLHFEEGIRQSTLDEFARELGRPTPRMSGFTTFIEFDHLAQGAVEVMRTPAHLQRMVREIAEDAAAQGCVWIEPAVWLPLHRKYIGPDEQTLEILIDAADAATAATGVGIGFLIASNRNDPPADALEQARIAVRWSGRGVVAFGLHNDESRFAPEPFAEAFDIAREAGLILTPHGGELAGPDSVAACLDVLHADRIQHGIRASEDEALMERLRESDTCLDVCPTSNIVLKSVTGFDVHPLATLLAAGVPVSLNADNPVMFDCTILSEYELARDVLGVSDAQLADIARASVRASGAPANVKETALLDIGAWITL